MASSPLAAYVSKTDPASMDSGLLAYLANLSEVAKVSPDVTRSIVNELADQRSNLKLIASENYCSLSTQCAMGNLLTDKYAEGYAGHRFYAGCDNVDAIETRACEEATKLFGCEHAYVQPHSGADANLIAYWAVLNTRIQEPALAVLNELNPTHLSAVEWNKLRAKLGNQKLLGMDYYCGGHLTHGYRFNVSAQMFDAHTYGVDEKTGLIDYDNLANMAKQIKPLILLAGYSAYPRSINFRRMREIADGVNAVLMVDMAHFAGLVAGGVFTGDFSPFPHAHIVTTTTHKTLRGPRGGMIMCTAEFAESVNKGCPLVMGGPLPHVIAAKTIALIEANMPQFKTYARAVVDNARACAKACADRGMTIATGGTDNHLFLIDVRSFKITGRQAESALRECGITCNRNSLPNDPNGPWYTSGLRIGTPAVTTLGMGTQQMEEIADIIYSVLKATKAQTITSGKNAGNPSKAKFTLDEKARETIRGRVTALLELHPVYPQLDLQTLRSSFGE